MLLNNIDDIVYCVQKKEVTIMLELYGKSVSKGIAIGKIYFHSNIGNIPKYEVEDTQKELERYKKALLLAKDHLMSVYRDSLETLGENESAIFKTHIMILQDSKFVENVKHCISVQKLNAEFAVYTTAMKLADIFKQLDDEYLQQRYYDIIDAANTLIDILRPKPNTDRHSGPVIIAAPELLPSGTVKFSKEDLLGFITNNGSKNSHAAILARTMELPAVTHISGNLSEFDGMTAIIDGQSGKLFIQPDSNTLALYTARKNRQNRERLNLKRQSGLPSKTKNGQFIRLSANITDTDISDAHSTDADGIGLFRTEYLFVNRDSPPAEDEQFEFYRSIIKQFPDSVTTVSAANLSCGKGIGYLDLPDEKNSSMGYSGTRVLLSNPDIMKTQLKALLRASAYGKLRILFPMINSTDEIDYIKRTIKELKTELRLKNIPFGNHVQIGAVIETPASAIISDDLARAVDFAAIDTHALTQYTLAIDHENRKLEYFYEPYHKSVLRLIKLVCDNFHKNRKPVSIFGELACDTYITPLFLALRADELAVVPSKLLAVKAAIRETDTTDCSKILAKL